MLFPPVLLEFRGFGAGFGSRVVLAEINLAIAPRLLTALMGPMGGGKSTLLRIVAGTAQQSATLKTWGEIRYCGEILGTCGYPSLVSQDARMLVSTVFENLVSLLPFRASLTRAQQRAIVAERLEHLACSYLLDDLERQAVQLGRLDQRLVAILRQTLTEAPLLCVDEPTAGLDEEAADQVLTMLHRWSRDHAVLMVTHHQRQARTWADRVALLAGGRIQEEALATQFFAQPTTMAAKSFVSSGTCPDSSPDADPDSLEQGDRAPSLPVVARRAMSAWCGPRGFVWLDVGRLAGTPQPGIVESLDHDLDALVRVGVTRLITLLEEDPGITAALSARGLQAAWEFVPDMQPPEMAQARRICERIQAWLEQGEVIAVHCRAGQGRTGTMLAAWRVWCGASALEAIEGVRRLEPRWIQSESQIAFLEVFAEHCRERKPHAGVAATEG